MQRLEECDQRGSLGGAEILSIGRHVSATLNHLPNQLILSQVHGHRIKRRPAHSAIAFEGVAVVTLFGLEDQCAAPFERCSSFQELSGNWLAAPRIHDGAPGSVAGEMRKLPKDHRD